MINSLDATIEALLTTRWPTQPPPVEISFDTPYGTTFNSPTIDLFLYDVRENLEMRNTEWVALPVTPPSDPPRVRVKRPRVQVDCSYIVTAWTTTDVIMSEHQLLSTAIRILLHHRRFPEDVLRDELLTGRTMVYRTLSLQTDYLSMGEFWQAMEGKPKVAFNYQVTLSIDPSREESDPESSIETVKTGVPYIEQYQVVKGRLVDAVTTDPIEDIRIFLVQNPDTSEISYKLKAVSDVQGRYFFGGLEKGKQTIRFADSDDPESGWHEDMDIDIVGSQPFNMEDVELNL